MRGTVERYGSGWRYRAELARDPATARRRYATKGGFRTEREAQQALHRLLVSVNDGAHVERSKLVVSEYLTEWLVRARVDLRPTSAASYGRSVVKLNAAFGAVRLQDLTPVMIEDCYAALLASGLAPKSVRNVHSTLRRALGDAERLGLISRNPARLVRAPAVRPAEQETWTPDELSRFLELMASDRLYAAFVLAATTGMRRGEVLGLRWSDLDLERGAVTVVHTITTVDGRIIDSGTKTAKSRRRVTLDQGTLGALRAHRVAQARERLLVGTDWRDHGLVFCRPDGSPVHPDRFSTYFTTLVLQAGLKKIRFHDLRHTHATMALRAGIHPKVVSERLGHATVGITLDLYSHVAPGLDQQAAETVAGLLHLPVPS